MAETPADLSALLAVLHAHFVLTLATSDGSSVYATPLYYAVVPSPQPRLAFASEPGTRHGRDLGAGPTAVAAAVSNEGEVPTLRGVQLRGFVRRITDPSSQVRDAYLARHPVAQPLLAPGSPARMYELNVTWAKLTDNARLGRGNHAEWTFESL